MDEPVPEGEVTGVICAGDSVAQYNSEHSTAVNVTDPQIEEQIWQRTVVADVDMHVPQVRD